MDDVNTCVRRMVASLAQGAEVKAACMTAEAIAVLICVPPWWERARVRAFRWLGWAWLLGWWPALTQAEKSALLLHAAQLYGEAGRMARQGAVCRDVQRGPN